MLRVSQLLLALASAAAAAAAPCPEADRGTLQEWLCFGELEYASRSDGQPDFAARFVFFANGERLYEKREPDGAKLMLRANDYVVFRGLARTDSTLMGIHQPFLFFEFAIWPALVPLAASESAPGGVPMGTTQIRYAGDGKAVILMRELGIRRVVGTIERKGLEYYFDAEHSGIALSDAPAMSVRGRWSAATIEPWPDSMPLAGWQYGCSRASGTDVRGNHRPVPPGVTLGDLRRGWKGPCE